MDPFYGTVRSNMDSAVITRRARRDSTASDLSGDEGHAERSRRRRTTAPEDDTVQMWRTALKLIQYKKRQEQRAKEPHREICFGNIGQKLIFWPDADGYKISVGKTLFLSALESVSDAGKVPIELVESKTSATTFYLRRSPHGRSAEAVHIVCDAGEWSRGEDDRLVLAPAGEELVIYDDLNIRFKVSKYAPKSPTREPRSAVQGGRTES
jgi:hypothetical protein